MSKTKARLPVSVIGGYLGAGKTTLINHLLRNADGLRLAVLVNEFGELAIDADLIVAEEEGLISIAGGCICCSFGSDLTAALMDLARLDPAPDHVLIETSGVAIPSSIAANLSLIDGYQQSGTVVLADAETIAAQARDTFVGDTVLRQLQDADLLLLSKSDLVTQTGLKETKDWLNEVNPVPVIAIQNGQAPLPLVLGAALHPKDLPKMQHSDAAFESVVLRSENPVDVEAIGAALASGKLGCVRAKGFVRDMSGSAKEIQVVGRRFEVTDHPNPPYLSIVVIGLAGDLDRSALGRLVPG